MRVNMKLDRAKHRFLEKTFENIDLLLQHLCSDLLFVVEALLVKTITPFYLYLFTLGHCYKFLLKILWMQQKQRK